MSEKSENRATPKQRRNEATIPSQRTFQYDLRISDNFMRSRVNMPNGKNSLYDAMIQNKFLSSSIKQENQWRKTDFQKSLEEQKNIKIQKALELENSLVLQNPVNLNQEILESNKLSQLKRTPQAIMNDWGIHINDGKMKPLDPRIKAKIYLLAGLNKAFTRDHPQSQELEVTNDHTQAQLSDDQIFLKDYLLKDVKTNNHRLINFSEKPYDRGCLGLAQLDHQQAQNQMDNWSAQTFAAFQDKNKVKYQEKAIGKSFDRAVKVFKKDLRKKIKIESQANALATMSANEAYLKNLAYLGLNHAPSDPALSASSSENNLPSVDRLPTLQIALNNRKLKTLEKVKQMKREQPGMTAVDSVLESAYDSLKKLEWGQMPRGGLKVRNPNPSQQSID